MNGNGAMHASPERLFGGIPVSVLADSYKAAHFSQYPDVELMSAYGEFRHGYQKDDQDTRVVFYGMRYVVENFIARRWTMRDVEDAERFFSFHKAPMNTEFPWPRDLFRSIVEEEGGYFPIKIEAMPEGSCIYPHVPAFQITAEGKYARLVTWFETLLCQVWYPSTVATLSRRCKDVISAAFSRSVDDANAFLLPSRLHDFGFRGCTCTEQSVLGGVAHLLNFEGSDTMSACYYAQFALNGGKPVASSIPATEHSVMMSWPTERQAISHMIERYGDGLFACVMDSYDYAHALGEVLPSVATEKVDKGGYMVLRPDSGDPTLAVLQALRAAERVFGSSLNGKGYKVIDGCGVIQGDGIDIKSMTKIIEAVMDEGFSAQNVAFGMGGGLLQKMNRDTCSFATKLSYARYAGGEERVMMKAPKEDSGKISLPGRLAVKMSDGVPKVFPAGEVAPEENLLRVVYDNGPLDKSPWEGFDEVRAHVEEQWVSRPPVADAVSKPMRDLMERVHPHKKQTT